MTEAGTGSRWQADGIYLTNTDSEISGCKDALRAHTVAEQFHNHKEQTRFLFLLFDVGKPMKHDGMNVSVTHVQVD